MKEKCEYNFCIGERIRCYDPVKTAFWFMLTTPWLTIKKVKTKFSQSQTTAKVLNQSQYTGTRIVIGYNLLLLPCRSYQCLLINCFSLDQTVTILVVMALENNNYFRAKVAYLSEFGYHVQSFCAFTY